MGISKTEASRPGRRSNLTLMSWAERQIWDAMVTVESMGADVRLTDAVSLLGAARERVADFVDDVPGIKTVPVQSR